ncbi:hypothetical protein STRDD11_01123 [Streptococcus sp. DD11]|nr:hypothetical protein STRDD11_01123 [Streptococcus sp. DD11]
MAEAFIIWYAASRGKPQISGRQSFILFWTYIKRQKFYYFFILLISALLIWQSGGQDINGLFCMGLLELLLLSAYTLSSHGIGPAERKSLF